MTVLVLIAILTKLDLANLHVTQVSDQMKKHINVKAVMKVVLNVLELPKQNVHHAQKAIPL